MKSKVEQFLQDIDALQEEYGMYLISQEEQELLVSLSRYEAPSEILCYTGDSTVGPEYENNRVFVPENLERVDND